MAASHNRDHSIIACSRHIHIFLFFAHIPFVVNHTINATPPESLQQYQCCVIFACFLRCVLVFLIAQWGDSDTRFPQAEPESSIASYIGEREIALYICAATHTTHVYLCRHPPLH